MSDLNKDLENFKKYVDELGNKEFKNFVDFENEYCRAINKGTELRNYVINNPSLCDENSLKVLTNQSQDFSLLNEKFKCLYSVITLTQRLLQEYAKYEKYCEDSGNYDGAIAIYEQMFRFSGNYFYYIDIANIYNNKLNDKEKCFQLYKELEKYLSNYEHYWWRYAILYENREDYFNALLCMQKAIKLELEYKYNKKEVENA